MTLPFEFAHLAAIAAPPDRIIRVGRTLNNVPVMRAVMLALALIFVLFSPPPSPRLQLTSSKNLLDMYFQVLEHTN